MALATTTFFHDWSAFPCFSDFSGEILFFHCHYVPRIVHNKGKIPIARCLLLSVRKEKLFVQRRSLMITC